MIVWLGRSLGVAAVLCALLLCCDYFAAPPCYSSAFVITFSLSLLSYLDLVVADKPGLNEELPPLPALRKGNAAGVVKVSSPMTREKKQNKRRKEIKEKKSQKNCKTDNVMEKKKAEIINGDSSHGSKAKNKLCYGFQHGNCSNGDKCQFAHDECSSQQQTSRRLSDSAPSSTSMMTSNNVNVCEEPVPTDNNVLSSLLSGLPVSPFTVEREKK